MLVPFGDSVDVLVAHWWALVLSGVAGIAAAAVSFVWPGITALALVYVIAAWALITGGLQIAAAITLRKEMEGEWLLALTGLVSILLGGLLAGFRRPARSGLCGTSGPLPSCPAS